MTHPFDLSNRVALVTGAGSGIGRETSLLLAQLGAHVLATDRDLESVQATVALAAPGSATAQRHDVTSESDWEAAFARAREYGRLDILVNNAGIMLATPFEQAPIAQLRDQLRINVESAYMGMQGALPPMKETAARFGVSPSIINVSSIYGRVAGARFAAYSASKGAVRMLSKAVAAEVAASGVRVNSLHPGPTQTNLGANFEPPRDEHGQVIPRDAVIAAWIKQIPMGRFGQVGDIAPVIAFLASDAARFITGAEFVVDGGYTAV